MEIFRCSVNLRFRHPDFDPQAISETLGIAPRVQWPAGTKKYKPGSYWTSESVKGEDGALLDILASWAEKLEPHKAFLEQFTSTGGNVELYVSWFTSERSGGETLDWKLLGRLAALRIDLSLDVYAPESTSDALAP